MWTSQVLDTSVSASSSGMWGANHPPRGTPKLANLYGQELNFHAPPPPIKPMYVLDAQSCQILCNPIDSVECSPLPGSSVHGILQARILEWVAISFSRESSEPRDRTWVSYITGRFFTI